MKLTFKKEPKDGEVRTRKIFCWIPYQHENILYWLRSIVVTEKYVGEGEFSMWITIDVK